MKQTSLPKSLLQAILLSYAITTFSLLLLAFLLFTFQLNTSSVSLAVHGIYVISCLIGGFYLGRRQNLRRLILGLLLGALYILFLLIFSLILQRAITISQPHTLLTVFLCIGSGIAGAVTS